MAGRFSFTWTVGNRLLELFQASATKSLLRKKRVHSRIINDISAGSATAVQPEPNFNSLLVESHIFNPSSSEVTFMPVADGLDPSSNPGRYFAQSKDHAALLTINTMRQEITRGFLACPAPCFSIEVSNKVEGDCFAFVNGETSIC